jgi:hypothetical protein
MSFQPGKKKSLSDRFGGISSQGVGQGTYNRDLIQRLQTNSQLSNHKQRLDAKSGSITQEKQRDKKDSGTLTVHLKINKMNRNKNDSYVNRPNQPLRIECRDEPSKVTQQFNRCRSDGGEENPKMVYNQNGPPQYSQNGKTPPQYSQNVGRKLSGDTLPQMNTSRFSPRDCLYQPYPQSNSSPQFDHNSSQMGDRQWILKNRIESNDVSCPQFQQRNNGYQYNNQQFVSISPNIAGNKHFEFSGNLENRGQCNNVNGRHFMGNSYPENSDRGHTQAYNTANVNVNKNPRSIQTRPCFTGNITSNNLNKSPGFCQQEPRLTGNVPSNNINTFHNLNKSPGFCQQVPCPAGNVPSNNINTFQNLNKSPGFCQQVPCPAGNVPTNNINTFQNKSPGFCQQVPQVPPSMRNEQSYIRKSPELSQNGPYCNRPIANNKSPGYIQSLHLDGFASSGALSQNSSSNNRQFTNDYNYDSCKSIVGSQMGDYGRYKDNEPHEKFDRRTNVNTDPVNTQPFGRVSTGMTQTGQTSPAFSSDSNMSLDSNSVAGFVEEQSKENIKPTAIYTDLSKEVFPEVEALKKKFFQECDGLTSTVQDQQIVHVVKNILQTTTDLAAACNSSRPNIKSPRSGGKEKPVYKNEGRKSRTEVEEDHNVKRRRRDSSAKSPVNEDQFNSEMKFEGRTLLKGGVKPRHIPKQLIDKPGLGPPTDRRVIYLTVRNLLEIPLPKWADENHGKHDMDDHNQEGKCDGISPVAFKTDRNHNSINTNTPDGKTGNKRNTGSQPEEKSNVTKPDSKLVGNKSGKINDGNGTVISNDKRNEIHTTLDAQKTKNENLLSKKLKMENMINPNSSVEKLTKNSKNVENLTLGLAGTPDKKKGNNIKGTVKVVSPVYEGIKSVNGSLNKKESNSAKHSDNCKRDKSYSRESSRSRRSRSRSRNRSRSKDRHSWRSNKQSDPRYKRSEHSDYRSRSRDVRRRSPVKTAYKPFSKHKSMRKDVATDIMKNVMGNSLHCNDSALKNVDMYDLDRNNFRAVDEDNFNCLMIVKNM